VATVFFHGLLGGLNGLLVGDVTLEKAGKRQG
jgi:hypothetical protein